MAKSEQGISEVMAKSEQRMYKLKVVTFERAFELVAQFVKDRLCFLQGNVCIQMISGSIVEG